MQGKETISRKNEMVIQQSQYMESKKGGKVKTVRDAEIDYLEPSMKLL